MPLKAIIHTLSSVVSWFRLIVILLVYLYMKFGGHGFSGFRDFFASFILITMDCSPGSRGKIDPKNCSTKMTSKNSCL